MAESEFPTTILTSKSPEEVANFLPHSLQLSSRLIEKNLLVWFANYAAMITRYNLDLNALVANGRNFFTGAGAEFGSLDKIWNCVALSVMSQIQVNESMIKVIKKDVLGQFNAAFKDDFKYSELLVNSEELLEMKAHLDDADGAYNWNVKAPAILANFENYKKFEKELIFNAFISYLNTVNTKTAGLVHKNENAVNFILKEYHIDNEMRLYTDYMVGAHAPAAESKNGPSAHPDSRPQPKNRPSVASMTSGSTAGSTPVKEKRKSKLRLKMGSILGRKKKNHTASHEETIPEDASAASMPSRQGTFGSRPDTRHSVQNTPSTPIARRFSASQNDHKLQEPPAKTEISNGGSYDLLQESEKKEIDSGSKKFQPLQPSFDAVPLQPQQPKQSAQPSQPRQPMQYTQTEPADAINSSKKDNQERGHIADADEEANFVRYSSSEDESDVPIDKEGRRLSLLNAHDLGQPPKVDNEPEVRSRNDSSGKYSFEYGDEAKSISTPQQTPSAPHSETFADHSVPVIPETPSDDQSTSNSSTASVVRSAEEEKIPAPGQTTLRPPPPPPPSRKAHPASHDAQRDSFLNLQNSRESYVPPHTNDRMSLVSQTTGNSLMRQDHFRHFGPSDGPIREGLNTSIAEIINATFKDGTVMKAQVLGEIAFNYNSAEPVESLTVHIPTQFSKYLLNDQLMAKHDSEKYTLNLAPIAGKTLGGIKYLLDLGFDHVPVLVKQIWKFEPKQASLIIKLSLNPTYGNSIKLDNLTVSAALDSSVASISASSKPEGSFNKDLSRITWRYIEPIGLTSGSPEIKLIARIITTGLARESAAGIKLRFTVSEGAVPNVKVLDSAHNPVPSIVSLSSGNYSSHT